MTPRDQTYKQNPAWWAARTKHGAFAGGKEHKTHYIWRTMIARCTKPKAKNYASYGGRGIDVCPQWLNSYEKFVEDMGECPNGLSIDRINNNKGYWPDNCRWATAQQQARNKRTTKLYVHKGEALPAVEWAARLGISKELAGWRMKTWGTFEKGEIWQLQKQK